MFDSLKNIKFLFLFALLMCAQQSYAQYSKWKVGFSANSQLMYFNSKIDQSQASTSPIQEYNLPNPGWGYGFTLSTDFQVIDGLMVGGSFGFSKFDSDLDKYQQVSNARSEMRTYSLYGDLYILKFIPNYFLPHIKENFFVRLSPLMHKGLTEYQYMELSNGGSGGNVTGIKNNGEFTSFGLLFGVGYTQYVSDKFSVSTMLNMDYSFGSYKEVINNYSTSEVSELKSNMFLARLNAEVKIAYDIKQKLPLCPIESCGVQQEHTHAVLGGARVRGNKYKHRQNQKYGDKHRGQVDKTKRKKTKTERQQERIQRKEKRNRKRIRIIGAGH
ncbi:porin family protein [Flammeovirga yaeyamensis]|uniref:Porin family protein n=1 Tax=Flammeovirga yaeyamensis TaxID=367791 RepID=A0AAX1N0S7_9BACT|nr:outer membrane beta-barrel protein [Flammeovirga yaeyamensis]MBB3698453.1 hypothetical protein [Flammeovirga yaeyamensis]NMF34198.1 porin family protein [Flammeovirga yaeyamensis]QWG01183.1 porin family protein [Flammeovirga yaeyamensis]